MITPTVSDSIVLKKQLRAVDLALSAARKRQSPRTGFVHYFPNDETASDTIPFFENFCFIMALFRQKTAEAVLEAKSLLERLLCFQVPDGNFPIYLHDYPRTWDPFMGLKIAPVLVQILRHFGAVLSSEIKEKITISLAKALESVPKKILPPLWEHRYRCLLNLPTSFSPSTSEEWFETLISDQLVSTSPLKIDIPFHPTLQTFLGDQGSQEKGEPRPLAIEWLCAEEYGYQERLLRDHPHQMHAALLFSVQQEIKPLPSFVMTSINNVVRLCWGGNKLHSLLVPKATSLEEGRKIIFDLNEEPKIERDDLFEALLFCDLSSETDVLIEGKQGTVFHLGEKIQIHTPQIQIEAAFSLLEGTGDFCGQISRANRPTQTACQKALLYEVFDWQIGLRTLRRSTCCKIQLELKIITNFHPE